MSTIEQRKMSSSQNNDFKNGFEAGLNKALDKSDNELIHLANFYHQHGYPEYAQDIYRQIFKTRSERNASIDSKAGPVTPEKIQDVAG
jgi:hypothetical protein